MLTLYFNIIYIIFILNVYFISQYFCDFENITVMELWELSLKV